MKIYTKTGDQGKTSLIGGTRVDKHHVKIECFGTVDELNSYLGLLACHINEEIVKNNLIKIQRDLFTIGAILATDAQKVKLKNGKNRLSIEITDHHILQLEDLIDLFNAKIPPLTHFIIPGGHQIVSYCHIARCVCRRAERLVSELQALETVNKNCLIYLNRLSDLLFVLARKLTYDFKIEEIKWDGQN